MVNEKGKSFSNLILKNILYKEFDELVCVCLRKNNKFCLFHPLDL